MSQSNRSSAAGKAGVQILLLALLMLQAGCQLLPRQPSPEPDPPVVLGPPEPSSADQTARLVDAMDRLQNGQFDEAERILDRLRETSPRSPTLALLARQLETSPERMLPGPYRPRTVQPGDTLSEIAEQELGNPLLFVALARLNGIAVPRTVSVGFELRVPVESPVPIDRPPMEPEGEEPFGSEEVATAMDGGSDAPDAGEAGNAIDSPEPEARRSELETVAEYLLASGQPTDARELLLAAARDQSLTPRAERLLVELALDASRAEVEDGRFDAAIATLSQVAAGLAPGPSRARLEVRRDRIEVQGLLERAEAFRERGSLFEAYRLAEDALIIDPDYAPAVLMEQDLRSRLVEDYHERALRAWRARDIDLAIRTWRELLDVVPDFEPAGVYLERAERLRARLAEPQ